MRLSNAEKLKMVLEHLEEGIPLHTLAAKYQYHLSNIKQFVPLYRIHWKTVFVDSSPHIEFTFEFKICVIKGVMNENISYRKLAVEFGFINLHSVSDWLSSYQKIGEVGIQTTHARVPYLKNGTFSFKREVNQLKENNSDLRTEGTLFSRYLVKPSSIGQVYLYVVRKIEDTSQ